MSKIKIGTVKSATPSAAYISLCPCYQLNTDTVVADVSGNKNNLKFNTSKSGLSLAEVWTTPNKASSVYAGSASTAKGLFLDNNVINQVDFTAKNGFIVLLSCIVSTPATNTGFIAQGSSTSHTGPRIALTTGNVLKPSFYSTAEQLFFPDPPALSAATPTKILLYFGGYSSNRVGFACFVNENSSQFDIFYATATGDISAAGRVEPLYIGMYETAPNTYSSLTAQFSSIHILKVADTGKITFQKLKDIAARYRMSPDTPLMDSEFV